MDVLKAATKLVTDAILDLLQADPHQFSERPCQTCSTVSKLAGRDFGCVKLAKTKKQI